MALPEADPKIIYRDVKHPRLEFRSGELEVILPTGADATIVLNKKRDWINQKTEFINECLERAQGKQLASRSDESLRCLVRSFVENASGSEDVEINSVRFRRMKTNWASCSNQGNLTFNNLMRHLPESLIGYVVFHETMHIRERKHNDQFWRSVAKEYPDCDDLERDLFSYWFLIQRQGFWWRKDWNRSNP